ncbi:D-arabinose 1-dehydrogenase (NAD(P)(+)) [Pichia californica]|uniref:D-arabinose 1-dehydrogenase (NAD(P)(+)) n=1 Tax=Pichia californica TaxID=460514 RepID=A0A9P6WIK1_9ASCO|nr:D-arabinose 1-dehydrogenase (NAD(P)(+)) [[Candida] californica]KAG0687596.1 D-arabinose 1-dehydrogenase (NAD(P)(+)) [[Candida] californica]
MSTTASGVTVKLNTGAEIPLLGFGTVSEHDTETFKLALKAAILDAGYKHIDTAWYYNTEELIGDVLEELSLSNKIKKDEIFITTKVWPCFWNDPETSLNLSLKNLKLEKVDLLLQHWPVCFAKIDDSNGNRIPVPKDSNNNILYDKDGDYLITYKKLLKLKDSGKAKAVGVSNYTVQMLERIIKETGVIPACNQVELHPHLPQLELYNYCSEKGIILEAYSPFGSSGAPNLKIPLIIELAKKYNVSSADIIVNYCIAKKIVVLPRSSNIERIKKGYALINMEKSDVDALDNYGSKNPKRYIKDSWGDNIGFDHWN